MSEAKSPKGGYAAAPDRSAVMPMPASGGLVTLMADIMSAAEDAANAAAVPEEKTKDELAAMSKDERTAYHKARLAAKAQPKKVGFSESATKAELRAQAREKQEADRKKKENEKNKTGESEEALAELKLQGLTEEQAREVLNQMSVAEVGEGDDDSDAEDETLIGSVRTWISERDREFEQAKTDEDSLRDFNLKVRFQGHVDTTPPDHLGAILHVLCARAFSDLELSAVKQPSLVAKKVQPLVARWSYVLGALYKKCDVLTAAEIVVSSIVSGIDEAYNYEAVGGNGEAKAPGVARDCAVVGFLMALREEDEGVDAIEDEDLLTGCKVLDQESKVFTGFMDFLRDEVEGSDEEASDDDA